MLEEFERGDGSLYQPDAAAEIEKRFGASSSTGIIRVGPRST